jgi:hypothetical protein
MPRPTLPVEFKHMRTFEVVLTQHTLDEVKDKMNDYIRNCTATIDLILAKKESFLTDFMDNNPYSGRSWRKCGPDRITIVDWIGEDEGIMQKCTFLRELYQDLKLMTKALKTNEYANELFEIERYFELSKNKDEELMMWEAIQYAKAKAEWEKRDAEWIAERKLKSEHESHKTRKEWELLFQKDPDAKKWYSGVIPDTEDTCSLCIQQKEFKRRQAEFEKNEEERMERLNAEYELSNKKERVVPREIKTYECEDCKFKCSSQYAYDDHIQSMEHKTVKRFCKVCQFQCRNDVEYTAHLTSRKHKLATGEEKESTEYICEPCGYTTAIKCNYATHCKTKGHIEKTK